MQPIIEPFTVFGLISMTIILGYIGSWFFGKTKIPDVLWLMLFGFLIGPIGGLISPDVFLPIIPFLFPLAIMVILFDAGLHMELYTFLRGAPRSLVLSFVNVILSLIFVTLLAQVFFGFNLLHGLLLGAIVGGTGTTVVTAITKGLKLLKATKILLNLESIFTTPICIIIAVTLAHWITIPAILTPPLIVSRILSQFSTAFFLGIIVGIVWMFILHPLKGRPFDYMLTLAVVFLLYFGIESVGGSGPVGVLMFGLVLANAVTISRMLKLRKIFTVGKAEIKRFHAEITFLIKSFFFVVLGIILRIHPTYMFYGLLFAFTLILIRLLAVKMATYKLSMHSKELQTIYVMAPRAEGAALLALLPLLPQYAITGVGTFLNIAFITILITVLYTSLGVFFIHRPKVSLKPKKGKTT